MMKHVMTILALLVLVVGCTPPGNVVDNMSTQVASAKAYANDNATSLKPVDLVLGNIDFTPLIPESGEAVTITANIVNSGDTVGVYPVKLTIDNILIETKELKVGPKLSAVAEFKVTKDAGAYKITIGDKSNYLLVSEKGDVLPGLKNIYPDLYEELLKLPDLKEIDENDKKAIARIARLALNPQHKPAFEAMFAEGIKTSRKYCSPLQALFWIVYDKDIVRLDPVNRYFLPQLLLSGWKNTATSNGFSSPRWVVFEEVADRLNSPELIVYYLHNTFKYDLRAKWMCDAIPAKTTFTERTGACMDHAALAAYFLKRNGYDKVYGMEIHFDKVINGLLGHIVALFQNPADMEYYVIDNIYSSCVHGPYKSIDDAADATCVMDTLYSAKLLSYNLADINLLSGTFDKLIVK